MDDDPIAATRRWLQRAVVGLNRTVSSISNDLTVERIIVPIIESIVGYCLTLLLSTLYGFYRRSPRITGILLTLATLALATLIYGVLNAFTFSFIKLSEAGISLPYVIAQLFLCFTVIAGWSARYFCISPRS